MNTPPPRISVYIPVRNEADRLGAALASVDWADEIVVIDTGNDPDTLAIAQQFTDRIIPHRFEGFGKLRNFGIGQCRHEWILSLDSDERCTPELAREIRQIIASEQAADAYWIPRKNWFMGRWIRHGGWYPDYCQPKLFRRGCMRYREEDDVHEGWQVDGNIACLKNDIVHFSFRDLSDVIRKIDSYSALGAKKMLAEGRSSSIGGALLRGLWAFFRIYVLKLGFLDGKAGLVIAISNFQGTFYRHARAAWQRHGWDRPPPGEETP